VPGAGAAKNLFRGQNATESDTGRFAAEFSPAKNALLGVCGTKNGKNAGK
jgi:hypothetical protein